MSENNDCNSNKGNIYIYISVLYPFFSLVLFVFRSLQLPFANESVWRCQTKLLGKCMAVALQISISREKEKRFTNQSSRVPKRYFLFVLFYFIYFSLQFSLNSVRFSLIKFLLLRFCFDGRTQTTRMQCSMYLSTVDFSTISASTFSRPFFFSLFHSLHRNFHSSISVSISSRQKWSNIYLSMWRALHSAIPKTIKLNDARLWMPKFIV